MNQLVSVIIPVYNKAQYLRSSLNSILEQDYKNIEVLIYDDCSTDNSKEIIINEKDTRIRKFYGDINKGVKYARDFLLTQSKGDYISIFDGDDIANKYKISKILQVFNDKPNVDFIGTRVEYINEEGKKIRHLYTFESFSNNDIKANLFFCNIFATSSIIFKKELIPYINFQSFKHGVGEDYATWANLSKKFILINIPDKLTTYRVTNSGLMANTKMHYADSIRTIHASLFKNLQISENQLYLDIHGRFMYAENITKYYLKKSIVFYNILFDLNNVIQYYNQKSFEKQIQINWLRKCIIYSRNHHLGAMLIYFKFFERHTLSSIFNGYILFVHSIYYFLQRKKNV